MIKYKAIARKQPGTTEGPVKYYASTVLDGEVGLLELCQEIEKTSTVSEADIMAVLTSLVSVIPDKLTQSKIVRLGDLGSFRPSIGSNGVETEEEVNKSTIKSNKVIFTPGKRVSKAMKAADYKKA
ncbi:HU family DNA-binding protein [Catalinimonas sp. 4WD22]|uniref:HU family DNA-binding protein n=1 Tax=Catalinimonas locisalis TaxID=3133978 RepID=UPI0031016D5F